MDTKGLAFVVRMLPGGTPVAAFSNINDAIYFAAGRARHFSTLDYYLTTPTGSPLGWSWGQGVSVTANGQSVVNPQGR